MQICASSCWSFFFVYLNEVGRVFLLCFSRVSSPPQKRAFSQPSSALPGSDFVTDIPYHRWDHEVYYDSDPNCWLQVPGWGKLWVGVLWVDVCVVVVFFGSTGLGKKGWWKVVGWGRIEESRMHLYIYINILYMFNLIIWLYVIFIYLYI